MGKKNAKETVENIVLDNSKKNKLDAVQAAIKQMEKKYGAGICQKLGDHASLSVEKLPTGILPLDLAVGIGGLPKGRIIEIYGPESAGKTLIALQTAAETQKNDGVVAYIDVEHALNVDFARSIGVNVDELIVTQPDSGEQALEVAEALIRSGGIDLIVMDSVAALTPQAEIDGEMGDAHVGLLARLLSQGLRKITSIISKTNTTMIFINQLRDKVGVVYGNPETTPGGRALKFYASVRMDVRKKEPIKSGSEIIGNRVKVKVVKNKVAPPFKECEFDLMFDTGVSKEGSVLDIASELDIIQKSGAWFSYKGEKLGQGRDNAKKVILETPGMLEELTAKIYEALAKAPTEESPAKKESATSSEILDTYGIEIPKVDIDDSDNFESFDPVNDD